MNCSFFIQFSSESIPYQSSIEEDENEDTLVNHQRVFHLIGISLHPLLIVFSIGI